jgi:hypothetical protein
MNLAILPSFKGRRFLPDSESPSVGSCCLSPFEQGSLHRRSGRRRPLSARQTWYSNRRTRVIVPKECAEQCIRSLCLRFKGRAFRGEPVYLTGALRASQIFGRTMPEHGYGRIIYVASLTTFVSFHEVTLYYVSNARVVARTRSLAVEWGLQGVCLNAIAPGIFPAEFIRSLLETPRGRELQMRTTTHRFGRLNEVEGAVIDPASAESSFTDGEILTIDGGFMAIGVNQ